MEWAETLNVLATVWLGFLCSITALERAHPWEMLVPQQSYVEQT